MKRSLHTLFLCIFLCVSMLTTTFLPAHAEEGDNGEVKDIVEKVELYREGKPITSGDVIQLNDRFELKYTLKAPLFLNFGDDAVEGNDCPTGASYAISQYKHAAKANAPKEQDKI